MLAATIGTSSCCHYRTFSPVTALPMIMRWISDMPSKMMKPVEILERSARTPAATVDSGIPAAMPVIGQP
jgi:hypothetical protein